MKHPEVRPPEPLAENQSDKSDKAVARRATAKIPEAKVIGTATWLGEGDDGPNVNTWNGITFKKGEPVDITDPHMLAKAKTNRFYDFTEVEPKKEPAKDAAG